MLPRPTPSRQRGGADDEFRRFQDSVNDAWTVDDDDQRDGMADGTGGSSALVNSGTMPDGETIPFEYAKSVSEYKRKLGLQRLALQGSSTSKIPGLGSVIQTSGNTFIPNPSKSLRTSFGDNTPLEKQRVKKFDDLLEQRSIDLEQLRKLAWSGVPNEYRERVWKILICYMPPTADPDRLLATITRKRREYQELVQEYYPQRLTPPHKDMFRQIHIDIPRMTIPLFQQRVVQASSRGEEICCILTMKNLYATIS